MAETESNNSKKSFKGSCHCGAISYDVLLSLPQTPTANRCNCTICLKSGFTGLQVDEKDFKLRSPSTFNELADYQFNSKDIHRYFCPKCGVQVFGNGAYEFQGQKFEFFNINVLTLDQPQEGLDLSKWKISYSDGRNDNWAGGVKDVPWPGGCV